MFAPKYELINYRRNYVFTTESRRPGRKSFVVVAKATSFVRREKNEGGDAVSADLIIVHSVLLKKDRISWLQIDASSWVVTIK